MQYAGLVGRDNRRLRRAAQEGRKIAKDLDAVHLDDDAQQAALEEQILGADLSP